MSTFKNLSICIYFQAWFMAVSLGLVLIAKVSRSKIITKGLPRPEIFDTLV